MDREDLDEASDGVFAGYLDEFTIGSIPNVPGHMLGSAKAFDGLQSPLRQTDRHTPFLGTAGSTGKSICLSMRISAFTTNNFVLFLLCRSIRPQVSIVTH